jgi:hypothetical protein
MMRTAAVASIVAAIAASCAHDAAIPPSSPFPSPLPSPPAKPELSEGPPRVSSVDPTEGTTAGGEEISILGGGFVPGKTLAEVRFGRKQSPAVTIASTNRIRVVTPPGDKGPVDIMVDFDDGQVFKIPQGFRYVEPKAVNGP